MRPGPRERLIDGAIRLMQERGVQGTGVSDLLDQSSAARQSLYLHFPGGKDELVAVATRVAGERILGSIVEAAECSDPRDIVAMAVRRWEKRLSEHDFRLGCPIAAATVDGTTPGDSRRRRCGIRQLDPGLHNGFRVRRPGRGHCAPIGDVRGHRDRGSGPARPRHPLATTVAQLWKPTRSAVGRPPSRRRPELIRRSGTSKSPTSSPGSLPPSTAESGRIGRLLFSDHPASDEVRVTTGDIPDAALTVTNGGTFASAYRDHEQGTSSNAPLSPRITRYGPFEPSPHGFPRRPRPHQRQSSTCRGSDAVVRAAPFMRLPVVVPWTGNWLWLSRLPVSVPCDAGSSRSVRPQWVWSTALRCRW